MFTVSPFYEPYLEGVLIPNGLIKTRLRHLANEIMEYYKDRPYLVISILKGSIMISNEIITCISEAYNAGRYKNWLQYDFVKLKSYEDQKSTGTVIVTGCEDVDFTDKEILIIDDIVDRGLTMKSFLEVVNKKNPKSIKVFSMLLKEGRTKFQFNVDYVGFIIPDVFIVGFGMDYNQYFRDLPHLAVLNEEGIAKFKKSKTEKKVEKVEAKEEIKDSLLDIDN